MYLFQLVTIKSISNTPEFMHVKTGQTSEEGITVVKITTDQSICSKDNSLICQVKSYSSGITNLKRTSLTNIVYIISKGKFCINPHNEDSLQ